MTKYTDEDKNLVILLRNQGYKIKHIAVETGCGESWVKKVISQNNKVTELEQSY